MDRDEPGKPPTPPRRILFIQIIAAARTTPGEKCAAATHSYPPQVEMQPPPEDNRTGLHTIAGPIITLLNMRDASQLQRGQADISHFIDLYRAKHQETTLPHCVFDLQSKNTLSWQLSQSAYDKIIAK